MDLRRRSGYVTLESNDAVSSLGDDVPWYKKPNLRLLYLLMFPGCLSAEMTVGIDMSLINGLQAVSSWTEYFHYPRSAMLGIMVAMYPLGFVAAVPFVPFVVDKLGRRYPIFLAAIVYIVGCIMQASASNYMTFVAARFILGFANVFSVVAASSLIGELSHPSGRAVMSGLYNTTYDIGAIAAAGLILRTFTIKNNWAWRIPILFQALPGLLQVSFILLLPESPRWLVSRGRNDEALAVLVKYHAEGDENSDFAKTEYMQIEQTLEFERKVSEPSWRELFSTPGMRKRVAIAIFLALSISWCGFGLTSMFLSQILDTIGIHNNQTKNIINLARIAWSLLTGLLSTIIAPRYPRRTVFLVSTVSLFAVFTALTIATAEYSITHNKIAGKAALFFIFLHAPAMTGFTVMISAFLAELFPFRVRAKGMSIYQWWLRIGAFTTQVMDPIGIDAAGWKWYLVYCLWNAFQIAFVYFMFPETSGRTLEELSFLYESDQVFKHTHTEVAPLCEHGETQDYETIRRTGGHVVNGIVGKID